MTKTIKFLSKNADVKNDILIAGKKSKTAKLVSQFYKSNPFPNYNDFETKADLEERILSNAFLIDLKKKIGFKKSFIEVGSGTCQLSLALAMGTNNEIIALDPTIESLRLGRDFAKRNSIYNVTFLNADLFDAPIKENYFDIVWCSGVLHHTENSEQGFKVISTWLKPDGTIIIGLYNTFGRLRTGFRQLIYKLFLGRKFARFLISKMDPYLRSNIGFEKAEAWIKDQYEHQLNVGILWMR